MRFHVGILLALFAVLAQSVSGFSGHAKYKNDIPSMHTFTNVYEGGRAIGKEMKKYINAALDADVFLNDVLVPYSQTAEGKELVGKLWRNSNRALPKFMQKELAGMAKGSGADFNRMRLQALHNELCAVLERPDDMISSATLALRNSEEQVIAFNLDAPLTYHERFFAVNHQITTEKMPHSVGTLTLGGFPVAHAVSWNSYGVTMVVNHVTGKSINEDGIATSFLTRQVATMPSVEQAITFLKMHDAAAPFSLTMGDRFAERVVNIEVAPGKQVSVVELGAERPHKPTVWHFNQLSHLASLQQTHALSKGRLSYVQDLDDEVTIETVDDVAKVIAGDGGSEGNPFLFRSRGATKSTVATVVMDLVLGRTRIWDVYPGYKQHNIKIDLGKNKPLPLPELSGTDGATAPETKAAEKKTSKKSTKYVEQWEEPNWNELVVNAGSEAAANGNWKLAGRQAAGVVAREVIRAYAYFGKKFKKAPLPAPYGFPLSNELAQGSSHQVSVAKVSYEKAFSKEYKTRTSEARLKEAKEKETTKVEKNRKREAEREAEEARMEAARAAAYAELTEEEKLLLDPESQDPRAINFAAKFKGKYVAEAKKAAAARARKMADRAAANEKRAAKKAEAKVKHEDL